MRDEIEKKSNEFYSKISRYGVVEPEKIEIMFYAMACLLAEEGEISIPHVGKLSLYKRVFTPNKQYLSDSDMAVYKGSMVSFFVDEIKRKLKKT